MKMHKLLVLFVLLIISITLRAENTLTPQYFNYKAELEGGSSSLRQLELSSEVLERLQRRDLGDLRVFNSAGQAVPHTIRSSVVEESQNYLPLVFYPFNKEQSADPASIRIYVQQQKSAQQVSIKSDAAQSSPQISNEFQYIIENTLSKNAPSKLLCSLKLDWQQPKPSMILPLSISSSDDLQNWSVVARQKTISRLNYADAELIRARIEIPCTTAPYLRLRWLKPQQKVQLKTIEGEYRQAGYRKMQWQRLGKPEQNEAGEWLFENNSAASMHSILLKAPQEGFLYKGMLLSRNSDSEKWRKRSLITQYRLKLSDQELISDPVTLHQANERYWKIKFPVGTRYSESQLPEIEVSYPQLQLIYLAQGEAPYTLAFGSSVVFAESSNGIRSLLKTVEDTGNQPDEVTMLQIREVTDKRVIEKQIPWKLIALWVILLIGTALMAYMAHSLYRQMNR